MLRARAVVLYAALAGVALLVLIVHYPSVRWVLLPWLIAFGVAVGEARIGCGDDGEGTETRST